MGKFTNEISIIIIFWLLSGTAVHGETSWLSTEFWTQTEILFFMPMRAAFQIVL